MLTLIVLEMSKCKRACRPELWKHTQFNSVQSSGGLLWINLFPIEKLFLLYPFLAFPVRVLYGKAVLIEECDPMGLGKPRLVAVNPEF